MSTHETTMKWQRGSAEFKFETYTRDHQWQFGTGTTMTASATPQYKGTPTLPNPEEALVGAIASCHLLTFLAMASKRGFVVESYEDPAVGHLEKNSAGRLAVTRVELRPRARFGGTKRPDATDLAKLHEEAHHQCFIANSVTTEITVTPSMVEG